MDICFIPISHHKIMEMLKSRKTGLQGKDMAEPFNGSLGSFLVFSGPCATLKQLPQACMHPRTAHHHHSISVTSRFLLFVFRLSSFVFRR